MKIHKFYLLLLIGVLLTPPVVFAKFTEEEVERSSKPFDGHQETFDYIIVGFGSAGAIIARQLSNKVNGKYKNSVLVLEAGPNNMQNTDTTLNPNLFPIINTLLFNPAYAATYPLPLGLASATWYSEGREWGGSAAHNGLAGVRGVPSDWNSIAANAGSGRWPYANVLPLMKNIETYTGVTVDPDQRGEDGAIYVTQNVDISTNSFAQIIAAVTGTAIYANSDYNSAVEPEVITSAVQLYLTPDFSRRSFSAYDMMTIGEIMDEKGRGLHGRKVRVMGNAVAARLLFDDSHENKVVGVEYLRNKPSKKSEHVKKVYAREMVILCAGVIQTPALLMRSGIGDKTMLDNLGIDVVLNNPHVGAHFQSQYGSSAVMTNTNPIPGGRLENFFGVDMPTVRQIQNTVFQLGSSVAGMFGVLVQPKSLGSVEIVSKDPLIDPKVNTNFYSDTLSPTPWAVPGSDANLIVTFLNDANAIATAAGELMLFPSPADYAAGDAHLFQIANSVGGMFVANHAAGTARMSASSSDGVVDGNLHVHKIKHLMIADMSVLNPITSGSTCIPAYVVGAVACDILGVPVAA